MTDKEHLACEFARAFITHAVQIGLRPNMTCEQRDKEVTDTWRDYVHPMQQFVYATGDWMLKVEEYGDDTLGLEAWRMAHVMAIENAR